MHGLPAGIEEQAKAKATYGKAIFDEVKLQGGSTLRPVELTYTTYGTLSCGRENVVVIPTCYAGTAADSQWLIGANRAIDPARWFVVVPDLIGGGRSTSPSTAPGVMPFPLVTVRDNVMVQHRLLTERLGVRGVALATGFSMGAQQCFEWACAYPEFVERIAPFCGTARTWPHNAVFLEGLMACLLASDPTGRWAGRARERAQRSLGRFYAGWGLSAAFYRAERWRELGYSDLEEFLVMHWEHSYLGKDPRDLMAMARTWRAADISANDVYGGNLRRALCAIQARALIMPSESDLYFSLDDARTESEQMSNASLRPIASDWGHLAGTGLDEAAGRFILSQIAAFLAD